MILVAGDLGVLHLGSPGLMLGPVTGTAILVIVGPITSLVVLAASSAAPLRMIPPPLQVVVVILIARCLKLEVLGLVAAVVVVAGLDGNLATGFVAGINYR